MAYVSPYEGETQQRLEQYLVHSDPRFEEQRLAAEAGQSVNIPHPDNDKLRIKSDNGQLYVTTATMPSTNAGTYATSGVPIDPGHTLTGYLKPSTLVKVRVQVIDQNNILTDEETSVRWDHQYVKNAWSRRGDVAYKRYSSTSLAVDYGQALSWFRDQSLFSVVNPDYDETDRDVAKWHPILRAEVGEHFLIGYNDSGGHSLTQGGSSYGSSINGDYHTHTFYYSDDLWNFLYLNGHANHAGGNTSVANPLGLGFHGDAYVPKTAGDWPGEALVKLAATKTRWYTFNWDDDEDEWGENGTVSDYWKPTKSGSELVREKLHALGLPMGWMTPAETEALGLTATQAYHKNNSGTTTVRTIVYLPVANLSEMTWADFFEGGQSYGANFTVDSITTDVVSIQEEAGNSQQNADYQIGGVSYRRDMDGGTGTLTHTFPQDMHSLTIDNTGGASDVTVTVHGVTYTVSAGTTFQQGFDPFTSVSTNATEATWTGYATSSDPFVAASVPFNITTSPGTQLDPYVVTLGAHFVDSGERFYGTNLGYLVATALTNDFSNYQEGKVIPVGPDDWWKNTVDPYQPLYDFRAKGYGGYLLRHPLMPTDLTQMTAVSVASGNEVPLRYHGDWLLVGDPTTGQIDGVDPYSDPDGWYIYFNDGPYTPPTGGPQPNVTYATATDLADYKELTPEGNYDGVQSHVRNGNVVRPFYTVELLNDLHNSENVLDVSNYVSDIGARSVTLHVPRGLLSRTPEDETLMPVPYRLVRISSNTGPLYAGVITSFDVQPSTNWTRLTVGSMSFKEFHNVDLSVVNKESMNGIHGTILPYPVNEEDYMLGLLRRSGFTGALKHNWGVDDRQVEFRDTAFWKSAAEGPGALEEDVLDIYWTNDSGSTLQELRNVANANLLELFDLPDGNIFASPLVPQPTKELDALAANRGAVFYVDADGKWVPDARVNLSNTRWGLDDTFSEVEVEGFSNEVQAAVSPGKASFVFAQEGEKQAMVRSLDGWTTDSNTANNWPYIKLDANGRKVNPLRPDPLTDPIPWNQEWVDREAANPDELPWVFGEVDSEGNNVLMVYPLAWFAKVGLNFNNDLIQVDTVAGSGRYVNGKGFYISKLKDLGTAGATPPSPYTTWADYFIAKFGNAGLNGDGTGTIDGETEVVWGIWGQATGNFFSSETFQFTVDVPMIDGNSIKLMPFVGKFDAQYLPLWYPDMGDHIQAYKGTRPRKSKRIHNPLVARIGGTYAVQMFVPEWSGVGAGYVDYPTYYSDHPKAQADQIATWLTVREFLQSRTVTLSIADSVHLTPNQFVHIARRPAGGEGDDVEIYDVLLVLDTVEPSVKVGSEAWVNVQAAYIGWHNVATGEFSNHMPLAWAGIWEPDPNAPTARYTDNASYQHGTDS